MHRNSACQESKALRRGDAPERGAGGPGGRKRRIGTEGGRAGGRGRWGDAPRVDERDGVRRRGCERTREGEPRLGGWEEKRKGEKRRGKGELFRFLTTFERRRLSARPTRDSCIRSVLRFFFLSRALADTIEAERGGREVVIQDSGPFSLRQTARQWSSGSVRGGAFLSTIALKAD